MTRSTNNYSPPDPDAGNSDAGPDQAANRAPAGFADRPSWFAEPVGRRRFVQLAAALVGGIALAPIADWVGPSSAAADPNDILDAAGAAVLDNNAVSIQGG